MKHTMIMSAVAMLFFFACVQDKVTPLFLTILRPQDGDTVRTLSDTVEGKATVGARVTIGFSQNSVDTTLIPNDTGRFIGTFTIPTDNPYQYSVYIIASYGGRSIMETRTVYYTGH